MLDDVLVAIADPGRRVLVARLAHGPATAGQLAGLLPMSRPAVSQHLRLLREAGLIRATQIGRHHWQELDPDPLLHIGEWIDAITARHRKAPALVHEGDQL